MNLSRRNFLKTSGVLASGVAFGTIPFLNSCTEAKRETKPFGLQLYTLRDVIGDDPEAIIREVAEAGYKQVESYEGQEGMFWGMGPSGFKNFLNDLGMTMLSSHANVFENLDQKVEDAAEAGMSFIVCPYIGPQESLDHYREIADRFNEIGETAKNAGLRFAYHNHGYTFEEQEGEIPQDVLMERTEADLVEFQMDIYWVVAAGADPAEWIRRYPNRFTTSHVKDYSAEGEEPESTILGTGSIDFPSILKSGRENGMEHFIVEQEAYTGTTPLDAIRENAEYMKNLDLS